MANTVVLEGTISSFDNKAKIGTDETKTSVDTTCTHTHTHTHHTVNRTVFTMCL